MPRFDPETIAALAEGRLSPDEAARLERAITDDPAALAELELQRAALVALGSAPEIVLTEVERAGLRAAIAGAIGLVDAPEEAAEGPRRVPWGAVGIAAAALFGLVAVVPVVGLLNTGGADDADTALAPVATTSRGVAENAGDLTTADAMAEDGAVAGADAFTAGEEAPGEELLGFGSTTTAAVRTTTTVTSTSDDTGEGDATAESTTTTAPTTTTTTTTKTSAPAPADEFAEVLADLEALHEDREAVEKAAAEALEENLCWEEDTENRGGTDPGDRWSFEYDDGDTTVVVYFQYDSTGMPGPFTVYDPAECEAIAEIPEAP